MNPSATRPPRGVVMLIQPSLTGKGIRPGENLKIRIDSPHPRSDGVGFFPGLEHIRKIPFGIGTG
jgi:hypothetical protein